MDQNNYTVIGPSIKGKPSGRLYKMQLKRTPRPWSKKPFSLLEHATDDGIHNEFRNRPVLQTKPIPMAIRYSLTVAFQKDHGLSDQKAF